MRKKAGGSWTVQEAQQAASTIARKHGVFECDRCATEIAKRLGSGLGAMFERLRTADRSDVIGLAQEGIQISANGVHVGVRIGDKVFDNLHHNGVLAAEWADRFVTATDADLVQESRTTNEFFRNVFLAKKFKRWLYGQ